VRLAALSMAMAEAPDAAPPMKGHGDVRKLYAAEDSVRLSQRDKIS
jgi:hypothetical protein